MSSPGRSRFILPLTTCESCVAGNIVAWRWAHRVVALRASTHWSFFRHLQTKVASYGIVYCAAGESYADLSFLRRERERRFCLLYPCDATNNPPVRRCTGWIFL